jgi:1-acyl-sn-glycerol-3-phosphate acyltransferase
MRAIIKGFLNGLVRIVYRLKIRGKENLPKEGGCIICPNHIHALDPVPIIICNKRKAVAMAKKELFNNPFLRWLANEFEIFPVDRSVKDLEATKHALKVLKAGEMLLMYPEGTRNGLKKGLKLKNGATVIAIKAGVPIIPVGISGTFKPFSKLTVTYGKPIYFDKKTDMKDKEFIDSLTLSVMNNALELTK